MIIHILWFAVGLILLIKGGDWFVDGAVGIAKIFHVPELLIGATVVSIGTTLPEVMVSATSAVQGHGAMAYGNAIGSIICNTALIAALTMAIRPSAIDRKDLNLPVVFFFIAAVFYAGTAYITGYFSKITGIILLFMFVIYIVLSVRNALKINAAEEKPKEEENINTVKMIILLIIGAAAIAFGADLLVDHGIAIAEALGVPETVIALTFVALGTSLPEFVTAITSLAKGHSGLSVGNICGANLFNLILVSGLSITLAPFEFSKPDFGTIIINGKEIFSSLVIDTPLMVTVMIIMTIPALIKGKLYRWQGILLLCMYAAFCAYQFAG